MSGLQASLLFGGVHGFVLAIVLIRRARNHRANRYLAALLVAIALLLLDGVLRAGTFLHAHPHLIGLTAGVPFALGPLVYLYVREMTAPDPAAEPPAWRHFVVPAAFLALLAVTFYPRSASYKLAIAAGHQPWFVVAAQIGVLTYGTSYALAALLRLRRHRAQVQARYSDLRGVSLRWLFVLAILNAAVWIAAIVAAVLRGTGNTDAAIVPLGSTLTVFAIGYFQLGQGEIFVPAPAPAPAESRTAPAYQRARLPDDDAADLEARVRKAMTEQHLYQRPGLTLAELADHVAATPHELSQVLSTRLGRNFYGFVNDHRVQHVQAALRDGDRPVLDLALEAGFQSKSTFNTAFRKATGMTPSEFRQRASSENRSRRTS